MTAAPPADAERRLRIAGRAVARAGFMHAYGHCSLRIDADHFLVSPSMPLGLVPPGEPCHLLRIDAPLPENVLGEVRIHREIYRRRPDVAGIVRSMPPHVMTLAAHGAVPVPRHGFGAYFHPAPELWNDIQLLRSDDAAARLADQLGEGRAILMRGNGAVVAGGSIEEAVVLTWYLEDMARVDLAGRAAGLSGAPAPDAAACAARATWAGAIRERMWAYLTVDDPEYRS
ncbi:class II aldolase/adducin family protein [Sphingosinicella microcystinivorans]|uniref:class II aldolase/adducin family protein n=1 Tax=Sphingosinicella microcystinivorans TaxID=335406 RepID=UPI0022F3EE1E|nr:class II aldolase/adducin family protein [Sphingosinicella microcystinivorans]WBX84277.1 class II aldolase/adducin family protein [Sphingosinicella microcystinivorans]